MRSETFSSWEFICHYEQRRKRKQEFKSSKKIGNLQIVEEDWNTCGKQILVRKLRNNGTKSVSHNRPMLRVFLSIYHTLSRKEGKSKNF